MNDECYIVAFVSGMYMTRTSKPYTSKRGAMNEYKRQMENYPDKNLRILQAQWINADFDYKEDD